MRNLQITKMDYMTTDEVVRREMSEIEIYGAMMYIHQLVNDFNEEACGERCTTLAEVDTMTYYCNKTLEIAEGGFLVNLDTGKTVVLDCVFCLENNYSDLFGYAHYDEHDVDYDEEEEMFLVRI